MAAVRISDPDLALRLVVHEARAQQAPTRELRDLGDGWLFHDASDPEPFWNRLVGPRWPDGPAAFDRRLDEIVTLFATLGRLPHVRPLPAGGTPGDLARRLTAAGFETMSLDRRMVLADGGHATALVNELTQTVREHLGGDPVISVSRRELPATVAADPASSSETPARASPGGRDWGDRRRWAADASSVLADAFGVDPGRGEALEHDVLACLSRPGCAVLLVSVDGLPVAVARRATTADGSYLSSIGTRPAFRGRGLGALATALAMRDAELAGSRVVHLAVDVDNAVATRMYERLGFVTVGEPAPDMLLFR